MPKNSANRSVTMHPEDHRDFIAFLKKSGITYQIGWQNVTGDVRNAQAICIKIENDVQLVLVRRKALEINQKNKNRRRPISVKTAAGGRTGRSVKDERYSKPFSLTEVAKADIVLNLVGKKYTQATVLPADRDRKIATVGANMRIYESQLALYKSGVMYSTASLLRHATAAGLPATGGHGTGIATITGKKDNSEIGPAFGGLITEMKICGPGGKIVLVDKNHPHFEAIRGAHLGMLGDVIDVKLQCQEAVKFRRVSEAVSHHEFLRRLEEGFFTQHERACAMEMPNYSPHEMDEHGPKNILIMYFEPMPLTTPDENFHPVRDELTMEPEVRTSDFFHLQKILGQHPHLIPSYMKLATQLQITNKAGVSVGPGPEIWHYLPTYPEAPGLEDIDVLIPIPKEGADKYIADIKRRLAAEIKAECDKGNFVVTDAIYYRFFQGTQGGLSTSAVNPNTHWVLALDIVSDMNIPGWEEFKKRMIDILVNEYNGNLHWGKTVFVDDKLPSPTYLKDHFPGLPNFVEALRDWHKDQGVSLGESTCFNDFDRRLLATHIPELRLADGSVAPIEDEKEVKENRIESVSLVEEKVVNEMVNISIWSESNTPTLVLTAEEQVAKRDFVTKQMQHLEKNFFNKMFDAAAREFHRALNAINPLKAPAQKSVFAKSSVPSEQLEPNERPSRFLCC